MPNYKLGSIRRSQIHQNGPGSIIDFRAGEKGGGPVSIVAGSLDSWPQKKSDVYSDPCIILEERLQKKLGKSFFRLPPVEINDINENTPQPELVGVRFPNSQV